MKLLRLIPLLPVLLLVGCASSTGIVPLGQGTYMIAGSQPGFVGTGEVKARLIKQAAAWCAQRNLVMTGVDSTGSDGVYGHNAANADVTFKALPPEQAAQSSPTFIPPTQVIETRAR